MPEQQVAVVEGQGIPLLQVDLDLHLIPADLLNRDQGGIHGGGGFHEHPALHLRGQQPLQALEFAHRRQRLQSPQISDRCGKAWILRWWDARPGGCP